MFDFIDIVQKSFHIGELCQFGIAPQLFELVVITLLGLEYVHVNVSVIDNYPLGISIAIVIERLRAHFVEHGFAHRVGNSCYLHGRTALTDNEILRRRRFDFGQIDRNDFCLSSPVCLR